MAQLDRLLSVLVSNRAEALLLDEGEPARLELQGGARHPVTRSPLGGPQIAALLREIAPADASPRLETGQGAEFGYHSVDGHFRVALTPGGGWSAVVRRDAAAVGAVAAADPAPAQAPRATAPSGVQPVVTGEPAARAVMESLFQRMIAEDASDLHLRCGEPPIVRASGEMRRLEGQPYRDEELSALLRSIMPDKNREEFAASNDTDFAYEMPGGTRLRANVLRDRVGIAAVFRLVPSKVVSVEQMGISPEVQKLCHLSKGLVLVTGPTGSGKSTTLCSLIDLVNRSRHDHVITIEDPIEFVHPNKRCLITQRQVGVHTHSFKSALRAALREDPDVILVGELRDLETVSIAIETAETGHLVFGTLHTTTAPSTIDRLIDQFPADRQSQVRVMLSESLKGVVSQVLCRKIGGGRVAAREILLSTPSLSNLIREGKTFQIPSIMQTSRKLGMVTLNDALVELVTSGQVEPREAYTKAVDKAGISASLKARGFEVDLSPDGPAQTAA